MAASPSARHTRGYIAIQNQQPDAGENAEQSQVLGRRKASVPVPIDYKDPYAKQNLALKDLTFGVHHPASLHGYTPKVIAPIVAKMDLDDLTGSHRAPDSPSSKAGQLPAIT